MIDLRANDNRLRALTKALLGIFVAALFISLSATVFSSGSFAGTDRAKSKHSDASDAATSNTEKANAAQTGSSGTGVMSINFVGNGNPMGSTEVAGVVAENNWVQASGNASASPLSLSDNTGTLTGASITWNADNTWILPITDQSGNVRMMEGYLDNVAGDPTVVSVSALPVTTQGYLIYVYADGDNRSANRSATYQITGTGVTTTNIGLTDAANTNFSGTFTQANNSAGNYVVFSVGANVTAFTITATPGSASDGTERAPVNGIQIVPVGTSSGGSGSGGSGGSGGGSGSTGEVISLNFVGSDTAMAASESAGVVAAVDWNNGTGNVSNSPLALNNQNGVASGATATWTADNVWELPVADQPGNQRMMNEYLDDYLGDPTIVTIAGLPSSSSGYSVYVYADGDNRSASRTGNYQISGTGITTASISLTDAANANFGGTFTQANNSAGNYVVFTIPSGVTGFTLTATPGAASDGTERAPVNGIQMVPLGSSGSGGSGGSGGGGTVAPPTVSITSPASGATLSGTVTVTASASSSIGIASVQFKVDGGNVGSPDTSSPYAYSLNTSSLTNGSHTLAASATDTAGTSTTSSAVSVTVSNSSGSGGGGSGGGASTGPLKVLASNPRYFTNGNGQAILLAGSHTWSDLVDNGTTQPPAAFNYTGYINFMVSHNFNFTRMWSWMLTNRNSQDEYENYTGAPYIWARPGPATADDGQPQWDLTQLNQAYFDRLRARIIQAGDQGIYTSVMLFDGWEWQFATQGNDGNPFVSGNNVNGINCSGTCPTDNSQITSATWAAEQAYIQKVVDTVNDLNNVMYEVSNEAGAPYSTSWQASVISFVKQYESTKPNQHPVGMTYQYEGGSDSTLYSSQADWVSPGTQLPPPATGNKVIINDTDHSFYYTEMQSAGQDGQREWAWENFAYGNNLAFMDPYLVVWPGRNAPSGSTLDPYWNEIRNTLTDIRNYGSKIDLANMPPQGSLSTSGYCLAEPGVQYLVFSPFSGQTITLQTVSGTYTYEWFNPSTHALVSTGTVTASSSTNFNPPFSGDVVLWVHK